MTGAEVFGAAQALTEYRLAIDELFATVDAVVVPTVPTFPTLVEVAADPIGINARLSRFTDFVNLLDCCAVAVPGAAAPTPPVRRDRHRHPGADPLAADIAARLHAAAGGTLGATGTPVPAAPWPDGPPGLGGDARGRGRRRARGLPLHHELTALRLASSGRTTVRAYTLVRGRRVPPKPGLARAATPGRRDRDRGVRAR